MQADVASCATYAGGQPSINGLFEQVKADKSAVNRRSRLRKNYVDLTAFRAAFFWRRGNRFLFFFASFGTFGFGGVETPTAAAIFPAAAPMVLAAVARTPSCDPSCVSFFLAMFWLF